MEINKTNSSIETIGRPIVNANIGVTNMIESQDIYSVMLSTFQDIVRVLSDHCGPYGKFAMITSATNRVAEPIFTKDGIGIVRAMEYMSVMQEYVRSTLAYMGSRIETAAGDGTTSSMIICADGLINLLDNIKKSIHTFSYTDLVTGYADLSKKLERKLNDKKYTLEKLSVEKSEEEIKELIRRIAYAQAFTSSHGNSELSEAVATLFAETPKEAWNYLYIEKAKYESDKKYEVAVDESQYTVNNVHIYPQASSLTDEMGTARIRQNVTINMSVIAPSIEETYVEGNSLYKAIEGSITDSSHPEAVYICSKDIDAVTLNALNNLFTKNPENNTVLFLVDTSDPRLNDIVCMQILNNNIGQSLSLFIGDYIYEGGDLKITKGLYENPTGSKLNPMVNNPDYPYLNEMLDNIDKIIRQIQSQTANRILNEQVSTLKKLRLKLLVSKRSYFRIGGNAYDVAAAADVVVDAILAVKNTLTKGFCLGGNKTLYTVMAEVVKEADNGEGDFHSDLEYIFCYSLCSGIKTVFESTVKWLKEDCQPTFDPNISQDIADSEIIPMRDRTTTIDNFVKDLTTKKFIVPIIQPVSVDMEIIKRFGELALKFVNTERIITPGGLVTNKKIDTV